MFNSSILDVAVGIVFVFLLVSVIASTINEIILSFLNMRGKELLAGLQTLLDDASASGLVDRLYNHGQVFGLFKGSFNPKKAGNLPAYIPVQNFVMAFLDIVPAAAQLSTAGERKAMAVAAAAGVAGPTLQPAAPPADTALPPFGAVPPAFQGSVQIGSPQTNPAPAQLPTAGGSSAQPGTASQEEAMFKSLWAAAHVLANNEKTQKVGKPLIAMLDAAGNDAAKLKKSIEDWYNGAMDRVSGWYKYRTQWVLFGIGLVLAVSLNVDAINIVKQLSKDSALRQSIVAAAANVKQPESGSTGTTADQIKAVQSEVAKVNSLGIPIGWSHVPDVFDYKVRAPDSVKTYGTWHWGYLNALLGWLMTAVAVSLGAPFWFDMLNKIMVVRSTVKPREKSQEEPSKDN